MILYRITLLSYGSRMLALFLYNSFLVARAITRQSEFGELDSVLLALDVGYRGSLAIFFFRKFFEFENTSEVFVETTNVSRKLRGRRLKLVVKHSKIKGRFGCEKRRKSNHGFQRKISETECSTHI